MFGVVKWRGEEYRSGSFVFLTPGVFKFKSGAAPVFKSHSRKEDKVSYCYEIKLHRSYYSMHAFYINVFVKLSFIWQSSLKLFYLKT